MTALTLFDVGQVGKARRHDRATSKEAARRAPSCEDEILVLLTNHPRGLTDDELVSLMPGRYPPTVKTARSRLAKWDEARVVDSGARRNSHRGVSMIVWKLHPWGQPSVVDVPVSDVL